MTSTGVRVPFLHGFPIGPFAGQNELASLDARERMAEFAAADAGGSARQGRSGQFLDLHLHQLAAPASLCPRLGREIQGPGTGGDRRPCAGVRIRKEHRQRSLGRERHEDRLPGRGRQQPCHLARFRNQAWPALYFIDAQGRVRHHYFGEGSYEQSEMVIQALLREAGATGVSREPVTVNARGHRCRRRLEPTSGLRKTMSGLSAPRILRRRAACCGTSPACMKRPARLRLNEWALSGDWTVKKDAAALNKAGGSITYRFHARDLHLVMGRRRRERP